MAGPDSVAPRRPRRSPGRPGYDLERLLLVCVEVFTRKGYDGTTMEDLSRALGISKSAIYHHVAGKGQILELALGRALDALEAAARQTRDQHFGSPIDELEHLVRESVRLLFAEKTFVTLLLRVRGNGTVERKALERRRAFDRYVGELVQASVDDGSVRAGLDPVVAARLLFGMVNSLVEWVRPDEQEPERAELVADMVCQLAFHGLRAGPLDGAARPDNAHRPEGANAPGRRKLLAGVVPD